MVYLDKQYNNWQPLPHTVIKDKELKEEIHNKGYAVLPWLSPETIDNLKSLYEKKHTLDIKDGGMFYSMYSRDYEYRKDVNDSIASILKPVLEKHFVDYKNIVNTFVVKGSGARSEFYLHQDTTALDEFKFSPLSLWIPLHDINKDNGAMAVVEKTHWFFSPYRGVSFQFPFNDIQDSLTPYLKPIEMQQGDVLVFDPRILHNSLENTSGENRISIVCGVFPKDSRFVTCYKDTTNSSNPIEIYTHDDDYGIKYPNFFYNCHDRPVSGEVIAKVDDDFPKMTKDRFIHLCEENNVRPQNIISELNASNCNLIAEPDGVNMEDDNCAVPEENTVKPTAKKKSFLDRLFSS